LIFDLHAIPEGIEDEIVFDDPGDERAAAVAVPEIDPGPGTDDHIPPDDPIPGRCLGRDPVRLLEGAGADYQVTIQDDVMGGGVRCTRSLDPITADAEAVDCQIGDDDVAGIDDLDGIVSGLARDYGTRARSRAANGYTAAGLAV
jgi:hypothetical protein